MTQLVPEDHLILRTVSDDWVFDDPKRAYDLVDQMIQTMRREGGIGLAANQIGINKRVLVMECGGSIWDCFNPEITSSSDELSIYEEGCLSFPGLVLKVKRPSEVVVKYQDKDGNFKEERMTGIVARCVQHEIDHLNGICFTDQVSKLKLGMAEKRRSNKQRRRS